MPDEQTNAQPEQEQPEQSERPEQPQAETEHPDDKLIRCGFRKVRGAWRR